MSSKAYNISKAFILCISVFFSSLSFAQIGDAMRGIKTVVIDPGHGGDDKGAVARYYYSKGKWKKIYEKDIALQLAKRIHKKFEKLNFAGNERIIN